MHADHHQLLIEFLASNLSMIQLAERYQMQLPDLLAWLDSPEIASTLNSFHRIAARRAELVAADVAPAALSSLSAIVEPSEDSRANEPTRKACAALLRHAPRPGRTSPSSRERVADLAGIPSIPVETTPSAESSNSSPPTPFALRLSPDHPNPAHLHAAAGGVPP